MVSYHTNEIHYHNRRNHPGTTHKVGLEIRFKSQRRDKRKTDSAEEINGQANVVGAVALI
jgi:hypothetical protein